MARTLIVYLHGIGDNIMLSGVLKEYCRRHPGELIDLVVLNSGCAAIWKGNPLISSVTVYPASQPQYWNPIKFYLSHLWEIRRYLRALNQDGRYQRVLFPTIQTLPEIVYHLSGTYGRHKIDRLSLEMGVPPELYPYDLHTTAADATEAEKLVQAYSGRGLVVLHPFSGHARKRIITGNFGKSLEMLQQHGLATLVVGAPAEKKQFSPDWKTDSAFGLSFGVLIEVLKRAEVFAGTDSAVAHLAAFANTPRIVIFSPKLKPERYLPISQRSHVKIVRIAGGDKTDALSEFHRTLIAEQFGSPPS